MASSTQQIIEGDPILHQNIFPHQYVLSIILSKESLNTQCIPTVSPFCGKLMQSPSLVIFISYTKSCFYILSIFNLLVMKFLCILFICKIYNLKLQEFLFLLIFQYNTQSPQHNQIIMTIGKLKLKQTIKSNSSVGSGFRPKKSKEEKQEIQKIFDEKLRTKDKVFAFEPIQGTGMIVTSGTSLLGKQTKFNTQVTKGDYIQIQNPLLKTIEQRPVMAVLGPNSILLSEPFLQQFSTFTKYIIKRSPKVIEGQDISLEYKKKMEQLKLQKTKQINKQTLDLRIKKGMWGYEKQTVDISKGASKQQLLDIRAKKIKDKHCW